MIDVHLISMPWSPPQQPPTSIGALKAYLNREFGSRLKVVNHSPFFLIPVMVSANDFDSFHGDNFYIGEEIFMLLFFRKFMPHLKIDQYEAEVISKLKVRYPWIDINFIDNLENKVQKYIEKILLPEIDVDNKNLIGFSVGHTQVYPSLYCYFSLQQKLDSALVTYVFGGHSLGLSLVRDLFCRLGVKAIGVLGEGEHKLRKVVSWCLENPAAGFESCFSVFDLKNGIIDLSENVIEKLSDVRRMSGDFPSFPVPDYTDFMNVVEKVCDDDDIFDSFKNDYLVLPVEGSRGCPHRCSFCSYGSIMNRFICKSAEQIVEETNTLQSLYGIKKVYFLDSLVDEWSMQYAQILKREDRVIPSMMLARTDHDYEFFKNLKETGLECVLLGIDALTENLLKRINKKATVVDNLQALKFLYELEIVPLCNIIGYMLGSTVADVEQTKELLREISHLFALRLSSFELYEGSVEWSNMNRDGASFEVHNKFDLPNELLPYLVGISYDYPDEYKLADDVRVAWDELYDWYSCFIKSDTFKNARFEIVDKEDYCIIFDSRDGSERKYMESGASLDVLKNLYQKQTYGQLVKLTGMDLQELDNVVEYLKSMRLVVQIDEELICLAVLKEKVNV